MHLSRTAFQDLSPIQVEQLLRLQDGIWPKEKEIARPMQERVDAYFSKNWPDLEVIRIEDDGELAAHGEIFPRTVGTSGGPLTVMALASVCTPESRRGEGLGRQIVREAFRQVDDGRFDLSLFQTRVPDFYLKLGASEIFNSFVNSKAKGGTDRDPWWNPHCMIYPSGYADWPEGEIDLMGPGW